MSEDIRKKVALAKQFKDMVDSLGGDRVHAAMVVPEFKIFLKSEEKMELEGSD